MRTLCSPLSAFVHRITAALSPQRSTAALCALTARLPEDTRRVVTLYKVYGHSVPDIAARLGFTPARVERHLVTAALVFSGCGAPDARGHADGAGAASRSDCSGLCGSRAPHDAADQEGS